MSKLFSKRTIALLLAMALCLSFAACTNNNTPKGPDATATPEPAPTEVPPLTPQPEIEDTGEPITYHVSNIFTDNMVVQRDRYIKIWGWADQTSGYIYGEFMGEKRYAQIQSDGYFLLEFSPQKATMTPQTLTVYPKNGTTTTLENILVGDVFIVGGQSNAELTMQTTIQGLSKDDRTTLREKILADSNIRVVVQSRANAVAKASFCATPQKEVVNKSIKWYVGSEKSAWTKSSAIGYYFALAYRDVCSDVPVGFIMMGAGGAALCELMPYDLAEELGIPFGTCYYNALTHPFIGLPFTGMLFYQGESNTGGDNPKRYAADLKAMVDRYRELWGFDFPFYNVQLSSHGPDSLAVWESVAAIRGAQFEAKNIISNYYLIVSMDVGFRAEEGADWAHPKNKEPVGRRLANACLATYFGLLDQDSNLSPEPVKIEWKGSEALLTYDHVASGLGLMPDTGDKLIGFQYRVNGEIKDAEAEIVGTNQVSVKIESGADLVRYGMTEFGYPENANLQSSAGYPSPAFYFEKN